MLAAGLLLDSGSTTEEIARQIKSQWIGLSTVIIYDLCVANALVGALAMSLIMIVELFCRPAGGRGDAKES